MEELIEFHRKQNEALQAMVNDIVTDKLAREANFAKYEVDRLKKSLENSARVITQDRENLLRLVQSLMTGIQFEDMREPKMSCIQMLQKSIADAKRQKFIDEKKLVIWSSLLAALEEKKSNIFEFISECYGKLDLISENAKTMHAQ